MALCISGTPFHQLSSDSTSPRLLWQVATGTIFDLEFLHDGCIIAACREHGLKAYGLRGEQVSHPMIGLGEYLMSWLGLRTLYESVYNMCRGSILAVSVNRDRSRVAVVQSRGWDAPGVMHVYRADERAWTGAWTHQQYDVCDRPCCVSCTLEGDYVVGSDTHHMYMYKYNKHGHQIWRKRLSASPCDLSINTRGEIIVSHYSAQRVTIHSKDGEELLSFPRGSPRMTLQPLGICLDSQDNILVCDANTDSIILYDNKGNFNRHMIQMSGTPGSVAVYNDKFLMVKIWKNDEYTLCKYQI